MPRHDQFSREDIEHRFAHHAPIDHTVGEAHKDVRAICLDAALELVQRVPHGRELALALTKLEEAMFHANAGVARIMNYPEPE